MKIYKECNSCAKKIYEGEKVYYSPENNKMFCSADCFCYYNCRTSKLSTELLERNLINFDYDYKPYLKKSVYGILKNLAIQEKKEGEEKCKSLLISVLTNLSASEYLPFKILLYIYNDILREIKKDN